MTVSSPLPSPLSFPLPPPRICRERQTRDGRRGSDSERLEVPSGPAVARLPTRFNHQVRQIADVATGCVPIPWRSEARRYRGSRVPFASAGVREVDRTDGLRYTTTTALRYEVERVL